MILSKINRKRPILRDAMTKLSKAKDREMMLKAARKNGFIGKIIRRLLIRI